MWWIPLLIDPAHACGGFFCNRDPIVQSKESIVFAVDEVERKVEAHVQIFYEGEARRFAWIVPVPEVPEVRLSSDLFFNSLELWTRPQFFLRSEYVGTCAREADTFDFDFDSASAADSASNDTDAGDPGIVLLASGQTGPYDWVVVDAASEAALLAWLPDPDGNPATDDGYDVPPGIAAKLGGYLVGGAKFVAFKLTSTASVGDIAPIALSFAGDRASIPLVLTSVAAVPDMRLQVFVLAAHRAVPENYLHVQVNDAAYNWLKAGLSTTYEDLVAKAADEAGGQAFATDFFGPTSAWVGQLWSPSRYQVGGVRAATTVGAAVEAVQRASFPANETLLDVFRAHLPMPAALVARGVSESAFYNCPSCYRDDLVGYTFDADALADALVERIAEPLEAADALLRRYPNLTRLSSSVSPHEMQSDPLFVLNRTMTAPVASLHTATLVTDCTTETDRDLAPRYLRMVDGTILGVPTAAWIASESTRIDTWNEVLAQPAAAVIERLEGSGPPTPIEDNSEEIGVAIADHNDRIPAPRAAILDQQPASPSDPEGDGGLTPACFGCNGSTAPVGAVLLLGALPLRRRRR